MQEQFKFTPVWAKCFAAFLLGILAVTLPTPANAAESLQTIGIDAESTQWSLPQLRETFAADIRPVAYTSRGEKHSANCIPILAILKAIGVPSELKMDPKADPKVKNLNLRLAVLIESSDGYAALFALPELLPEIGNREAWLALNVDGQPLPEKDGPTRLIVPTDQKPARWVRSVSRITVIDCAKAAITAPTTRPVAQ